MNPNDKRIPKPRKHLMKDAVPTLFDIPNPPKSSDGHRSTASILKRQAEEVPGLVTKKPKRFVNILLRYIFKPYIYIYIYIVTEVLY